MRRTAMFYIGHHRMGDRFNLPEARLFIGTAEEAFDELKEEVKTLYPDEYDRMDRHFWAGRRAELLISNYRATNVVCHDGYSRKHYKPRYIRMEMSGGWKEETNG